MKKVLTLLKWLGIGLTVLIVGVVAFVLLTWNKTFDAPLPHIAASTDSAIIDRGKHLVFGPAHCATCHVPMHKIMEVEAGLEMPLVGGWELHIPPGSFRAPNLTPDPLTGIGNISDPLIARALRHSVGHTGHCLFDFMPFQQLSDADLLAIVSFLRSQEPVGHAVEPTKPSFLGKALLAFGALKPKGPNSPPPSQVEIAPTPAFGEYLARSVANCMGCHTERDLKSGALVGQEFAGGSFFPPHEGLSEGYAFVSPNITPHKESGVMANWDQDEFIRRFRAGRLGTTSPMPWGAFSRMTDTELKALYLFLQTLNPVDNKVVKTIYAPGEPLPV
ncbi:MAG: cytochrome C [Bacteroidetes bacterium]|jgi:mono/diheme cytochrome c family protein|nr:cytochrome C [Bacteroidota bacterium]